MRKRNSDYTVVVRSLLEVSDNFLSTDGKYIQTRTSCLLVFATRKNIDKNIINR